MIKRIFPVSGMKCVNCKANVERAIQALDGVSTAVVCLEDSNVEVEFDEAVVSPKDMKAAVDDLGRFEMEI